MADIRRFLIGCCTAFIVWFATVVCWNPGAVAEAAELGQELRDRYPALRTSLEKNQFGAPIFLESKEGEDSLRVDMYGIIDYPFDTVSEALSSPANWCDITSLHINIKACTYSKAGNRWLLTLYSGRKQYQPPSDAYPIKFTFRLASRQPQYLDVTLAAKEGPLSTRDHRIRLEAVPLDPGRTLVHFSSSYSHGYVARMAIKSYFSTLGRDKVGFSILSRKGGRPVYVTGVRGAVERNAVRYYLALQTYIDTLKYPEGQRFEQRISRWYDLTAKYPRQLKETEKPEYLSNKRLERRHQFALQKKLGEY